MGYGGNLIWTTVFKALHERDGRPVAPVHMPLPSDLLAGRGYDGATTMADDPIYRGNPRLHFPPPVPKSAFVRAVDRAFERVLSLLGLRIAYERWILRRTQARDTGSGPRLVHVDMRIHSYASGQTARRTYWKDAPRAATAMLENLGGGTASDDCEMYFADGEAVEADAVLHAAGVDGPFVAIEPDTNREYFGELRSWPSDRWVAAIARLRGTFSSIPVVQLGVGSIPALPGVVDLRGKTTFRTACLILRRASLFVGTESGLMHAANAVGARAVILWGGVTLPEFIGYPTRQRTLCKYVPCAPCGNNGWCDREHACMRGIEVDEVVQAVSEAIAAA